MSSYSEYLGRMKQRLPNYIDTRPHRDAGHQTEVVKRLAASAVQEQLTNASSRNMMLNGPSTQVLSPYKTRHTVQDTSRYNEFTAGQEVAQSERVVNRKPSQIQGVCYSSTVVSEKQDTLRIYPQEALKQAAKNAVGNCCRLCGEPAQFTTACPCTLTATQQTRLLDATRRFTTPS
jgi:hypothetical protein